MSDPGDVPMIDTSAQVPAGEIETEAMSIRLAVDALDNLTAEDARFVLEVGQDGYLVRSLQPAGWRRLLARVLRRPVVEVFEVTVVDIDPQHVTCAVLVHYEARRFPVLPGEKPASSPGAPVWVPAIA